MRHPLQRLSRIALPLAAIGIGATGCASLPQPVNKPCGVIVDSLQDVHATTKAGETRISKHFERGVAAGCWGRAQEPAS